MSPLVTGLRVVVGPDLVTYDPSVQGIGSSLDDLTLGGRKWRAEVGEVVESDPVLSRSTEGASTLEIPIRDGDRRLLTSPLLTQAFDVDLDGLGFRFVKLNREALDAPLALTFEDREVARLRVQGGPRKASRQKVTRAEFSRRLVREARGQPIPFYSPQLHVRQPIASARQGRANASGKLVRREQGLDRRAGITIQGVAADATQIRNMERVLDVGRGERASKKVLIAAAVTIIVESWARNLGGGDRDSVGIFQQRASQGWPASQDVERDARAFYRGASTNRGAISISRSQPRLGAAALAQEVQRSGHPERYRQWLSEAEKAVNAYLAGGGTSPTVDQAKYQFERGKKETTWDCIGRLAEEVAWRRWCSSGVVYFIAETDLLASKRRAVISDSSPGVTDLSFDYDAGKVVGEARLTAWAAGWGAPPGTVVDLERCGPADGRYVVASIRTTLRRRNSPCEIVLRRPTPPLPEPSPQSSTSPRRTRSDSSASGPLLRMIREMDRIDELRLNYQWGGGHVTPAPRNGPFDCSSAVSRILQVGGFRNSTMVSGTLARWGRAGAGTDCTIYANSTHVLMAVKRNGEWRFWGTSSSNPGGGPGWISRPSSSYLSAFTKRHPPGL